MSRPLGALVTLVALMVLAGCMQTRESPELVGGPLPPVRLPIGYVPPVHRPNVLVIEADDLRVDDLQWMPNVRHLLVDRGVTFANSFAPYPLCCPSRASFLSGKYTHNTGVYTVHAPYAFHAFNDSDTIAVRLQRAGYQTALIGKYLNGYGDLPRYHSRQSSVHYVPPGWTTWLGSTDHIYPIGSPLKGNTYNYFSMTQVTNGGRVVPHPRVYSTLLTGDEVRSVTGRFGRAGKPWFVWWTPIAPHFGGPFEADDPGWIQRADGGWEQYKTPARPEWAKGMFDHQITRAPGQPEYGPAEFDLSDKPLYMRALPEQNTAEVAADTQLARQRAEATFALDQEIGKTLRRLRQTGQYDDTVVMFTSDNGYYLGEHRRRQGKITLHEPSLRVPFVVAGPGIRHGVRFDPISTVDLAPTIASYAGATPPQPADGVDLRAQFIGPDRGWTRPVITEGDIEGVYTQHLGVGFDSPLNERGLRLGRWNFVKFADGEYEVYDLVRDPLELQNLSGDPASAGLIRRLEALWRTYLDCAGRACTRPLPSWARVTPAQEARITVDQLAETATYYGDPGWLLDTSREALRAAAPFPAPQ